MRIAPKPLDPDEVMEIDFACRRIKASRHVPGEAVIHTEIYKARPEVCGQLRLGRAPIVHPH
jgi:ribulose-5-phosphate 4-epimerase/fuculose-1-phosphate aldolase